MVLIFSLLLKHYILIIKLEIERFLFDSIATVGICALRFEIECFQYGCSAIASVLDKDFAQTKLTL